MVNAAGRLQTILVPLRSHSALRYVLECLALKYLVVYKVGGLDRHAGTHATAGVPLIPL